jgi:hypothetical protein
MNKNNNNNKVKSKPLELRSWVKIRFFPDFGIDTLMERVEKTTFPWLMSNVIDNETGQPLADGKVSHIIEWCGRKIGLVYYHPTGKVDQNHIY